jgi:hypothetical protein
MGYGTALAFSGVSAAQSAGEPDLSLAGSRAEHHGQQGRPSQPYLSLRMTSRVTLWSYSSPSGRFVVADR